MTYEAEKSPAGRSQIRDAARWLDISVTDLERASLLRVIKGLCAYRTIAQIGGVEYEMHRELQVRAAAAGRKLSTLTSTGVLWPWPLLGRAAYAAGSPSTGGALVEQTMQFNSPIDTLRPYLIAAQLGVDSAFGFRGNPVFPRITAAETPGEAAESVAVAESEATFDNIVASPHVVSTWSSASRLFRQQAQPNEGMIGNDILRSMAVAIESLFWTGSGSDSQPLGLLNASGINAVSGSSATYDTLLAAQQAVLDANGLVDKRSAGWAAAPDTAAIFAKRFEATSNVARLWQGSLHTGRVLSDLALSSTVLPANVLMFGDFSAAVIVFYGLGIEINVNPYSGGTALDFATGNWSLRGITEIDVITRHGPSFAAITGIT